jgi:hypothetical protein
MRVKVRPMRHQGRDLQHKELRTAPPFEGELRIAEARDPYLSRQVVRARLLAPGTEADILPVLVDARLLWAANNELRLTGFEQVETASFAQTWNVEVG